MHAHTWDQLLYASEGVLSVETEAVSWIVPPLRACWLPAGTDHGFRTASAVELRTLYLPTDIGPGLPRRCQVLTISPLVRELILHVVTCEIVDVDQEGALVEVLLNQLREMQEVPLFLPWPRDARALRLAQAMDEGAGGPLDELCRRAGASKRTMERLFYAETGISLGRWRTQVHVSRALALLSGGTPVAHVAEAIGYSSPSAFIAMFRRNVGETPAQFHKKHRATQRVSKQTPIVPVPTTVRDTGEYLGPESER